MIQLSSENVPAGTSGTSPVGGPIGSGARGGKVVLPEVAHLAAASCGKRDDELTPATNIVAAGIQS